MIRPFGSFRYKYQTYRRKTLSTNRLFEQKSIFKPEPIENYDEVCN